MEFIGELPIDSSAEVTAATARGRQAQAEWQARSFEDRAKALRRFRDLLIDQQDRLADIVTSETGKPRADVFGNELFYVCDAIGFWTKRAEKWLKQRKIRPHLFKVKKVLSTYQPLGLVGIISPWNIPLV